eukprot:scaffold11076_cov122-Cylindrotheca_fusiformis.AAC.9
MGRLWIFTVLVAAAVPTVSAFASRRIEAIPELTRGVPEETRRSDFLKQAVLATSAIMSLSSLPAYARGRATLDYAYERYVPRIIDGGEFFKRDMATMIVKSDWAGIKNALAEPPKKSRGDRSKVDGGVAERAAQAGRFSDSRVLVACDLFASSFSDNSISPKTKAMKKEVDLLRSTVKEMNLIARQALGEDTGGGLFGMGTKKVSKDELSRNMKQLYIHGGQAWNRYVFAANDGLPVQMKKIPYL